MAINAQQLEGQWNQLRGLIKKRWAQLTDDDLQMLGGNLNELVGYIQEKTGDGREAIESFLSAMTSRSASAVSHATETAGRYTHHAIDEVQDRYDRAERVVRHHPGQTVAMVFGIGLVAGLIVGLSMRHR